MSDLVTDLQQALGDSYRLERELGGGGMSRVFLAVEASLKRNVVVKVLPPLRHRIQKEGLLPVADALRILRKVADALAYALRRLGADQRKPQKL